MSLRDDYPSPSELVRLYGGQARKRFGQNFLVDGNALERIVQVAGIGPERPMLEIGPGPGALTVTALKTGARVEAIELDRDICAHLEHTFGADPNFSLTEGDALRVKLADFFAEPDPARRPTVVANLPYNVATPILLRLIDLPATAGPERMVLMFQKEVAERICARPGERASGWLTLAGQIRFEARIALKLPPGAFRPSPKVDSAVVRFDRRTAPLCGWEEELQVRELAAQAFQQRRKTMRNSLRGIVEDRHFAAADIDDGRRPESLTLDEWIALATATRGVQVKRHDESM